MNNIFTKKALNDYLAWQQEDKKTFKTINLLLTDIGKTGINGRLPKDEILKNRKCYSRKIDDNNCLVYDFDENEDIKVISCKGFYNKKA